jgi:ABC-type sugar transport system permease subunit
VADREYRGSGKLARPHVGSAANAATQSTSTPPRMGPNARRNVLAGLALTLPAFAALTLTLLYPMGWTLWLGLNGNKTALRGSIDFILKPVIAVILVLRIADAFRIFDVVYVLTGAGPAT